MRQYYSENREGKRHFWFVCDDKTCPNDTFEIIVTRKKAKQIDGTYLTVM